MEILYIIPGWEDTGNEEGYQKLQRAAEEKGYEVVIKNIDWAKPLSQQTFTVSPESVVFGFSLGAILAWLVAQENRYRHLILASMTPHYSFTDEKIKKALIELAGEAFVTDIIDNLKKTHLADRQTILYGDKENELADVLVSDTGHELTDNYVKAVAELL